MTAKQEEQLNDPVDILLTQADEPAEAPAAPEATDQAPAPESPQTPAEPEAPAAPEGQEEQPPESPPAEAEVPAPPSEPVETTPESPEPVKTVPLAVLARTRQKARSQLDEKQRRIADLERENTELRKAQPQEVDPWTVWKSNPENEGTQVPDQVMQQHDAFVAAQARRQAVQAAPTTQITEAQRGYANNSIATAPREIQAIIQIADGKGWITPEEVQEIARHPNPAQRAFEIAQDHVETFGDDNELTFLHRLFPPKAPAAPKPQRAAQPQRVAVPRTPAPAPQPKPQSQETTDENDFQPFPEKSHAAKTVEYMFGLH